jgi:hypothetical protein
MAGGVDGVMFRQVRDTVPGLRRVYAVHRTSDDRQIGYVWTHDLERWLAGAEPTLAAHYAAFGRGRPAFGSRAEAAESLMRAHP